MKFKYLILTLTLATTPLLGDVTPNVPEGTPYNVTYEQDAVALTLLGEAGGEGQIGVRLVADVIHERMKRRKMTPFEVVSQPNQFAGFMEGERTHELYVFCLMLAIRLGEGYDPFPKFSFDQFRAFKHSPIPSWAVDAKIYKNHVFFSETK